MNYVRDLFKIYIIIFLIRTMSDSDLWASQVINELIEEIATFDRNADVNLTNVGSLWQNHNTDGVFMNQESKKEHAVEESRTYRDYITGSPCKFEEESALLRSTNDVRAIKDEHSDDSLEFQIQENNDHFISSFTERDSRNDVKTTSGEVGNIKDVFDNGTKYPSGEIAEVRDSTQDITREESTAFDISDHRNLLLTDSTDVNDDQSKCEKESYKQTDEMCAFLTTRFESETGSSDDYLKRTDEKVRSLGFEYQIPKDGEPERSSSLTSLYLKYFEENYIREEMDYRWRFQSKSHGDEKTDTNLLLESNIIKTAENNDFKRMQEENANETERKGRENERFDRKREITNQVEDAKSISNEFRPFKRKKRNILEEISTEFENIYSESRRRNLESTETSKEYALNIKPENNVFSLVSDDNVQNINLETRTAVYTPERNNNILPREIFSPKFLRRKRRKLYNDEDDDLVITKRVDKIITVYRTTCRVFEELFLRPSATIIVGSIEFLVFLFFLGVCGLCIIYKAASYSSLKKNKDSFIDLFKKGNQTVKSSFSKLFLLQRKLDFRGEMDKNSFETETPRLGCSQQIQSNDTPGNKIQLNVEPDDVFVLNSVFEQVKQNLEDMYEKGDNYFECLNKKRRVATIASPGDDFVDIILRECKRVIEEPHSNRNELDNDVTPSSNAICCREHGSNESIARKVCNSPRTLMNCCEEKLSHCSKLRKRINSTESLMKEFNIDSDRRKGFVLHSTVIEDTEFSAKGKNRNRSKFRPLSPSNKSMSESISVISSTPESLCIRNYSSSSMSVNVPSFRSRSLLNLTADSPTFGDSPGKVLSQNTENNLLEELNTIYAEAIMPPVILAKPFDIDGLGHSITSTSNASIPCVKQAEKQCSGSTENCVAQTSQNVPDSVPVKSNFSDDFTTFENVDMSDDLHVCSLQCGNSFSYDNPNFLSEFSTVNNSSNEQDSLVMHESSAACDERNSKGRKNSVNLRRRMSLILNNWRNTSMMQCVTSNLKGKKKYKKQLNIIET